MSFLAGAGLLLVLATLLVATPLWRRGRRTQSVLAAVFVAGTAIGIYLLIGRPDLGRAPPAREAQTADDVVAMVEQLAARLERAPDDPRGWTMLGRAYVLMQRYDEAARAFGEALQRTPGEDADLIASYAEAQVLQDPAALGGEAGSLFERALELDPANPRGLWYGGLAAEGRGNNALAVRRWQVLLERELPTEFRAVVESRLAALDADAGDALLTVRVTLDSALRESLPAGGVLFVALREADGGSSGPPLAARRVDAFELPHSVPLTSADLLRGGTLPEGELVVSARISADGDATPGPGDVEGSARWDRQAKELDVRLDRRREQ